MSVPRAWIHRVDDPFDGVDRVCYEADTARALLPASLCLSAFFTALGGSLYAQKELYIDPGSVLSTALSIKMALVTILGGVGNLFGPVVGSALLTGIEEVTRQVFGGSGRGTDLILYALIIIGVAVFYPTGIMGWIKQWRAARTREEGK